MSRTSEEKMSLGTWPALLAAAGALTGSIISAHAGELRVSVTPAVDGIKVLDPLHVRVALENGEKRAVAVSPMLSTGYGTIEFYLRREGDKDFAPFHTPFQGVLHGDFSDPVWVGPGRRPVAYELLFRSKQDKPAFPAPGRYDLKARVVLSDERQRRVGVDDELFSDPVQIVVTDRPAAEKELIQKSGWPLMAIHTTINAGTTAAELWKIERQLTESNAKRTLEWGARLLEAIERPADGYVLWRKLYHVRMKADPVTAEIIGLAVAHAHAESGDWERAALVLETLEEPSVEKQELWLRSYSRQHDRGSGHRKTTQQS
jgi:hypothetical protein